MFKRIIPSDTIVPVFPSDTVYFLAGPIRGGDDWQAKAVSLLRKLNPSAFIAIPKRYDDKHPLAKQQLENASKEEIVSAHMPLEFGKSVDWERYYLALAAKQGCIIFWLPWESKINPRPKDMGPYGRDTYGELGEWRMRMKYENAKVVIGGECGFSGIDIIYANFQAVLGSFTLYGTLEDTVRAGIAKAHKK